MNPSCIVWMLCGLTLLMVGTVRAQAYYVYVAAEAEDAVYLVRFDSRTHTAKVVKRTPVGRLPEEIEQPRGLAVAPDGTRWYVSLAHGNVVKYRTDTDEPVGETALDLAPGALHLSAATGFLYAVSAHPGGEHEPGVVSVINPATMTEVGRATMNRRLHSARLSPDGRHLYSVATQNGMLYEIDATTFEVTRRLDTNLARPATSQMDATLDGTDHAAPPSPGPTAPNPTGAAPHPTKPFVYVANNGTNEILEASTHTWEVTRRFESEVAPYHLDVTPDGVYLIATQKTNGSTGFFNLERGEEVVRIQNSRPKPHGVVTSPDGRYAFVSVEGTGDEPGAVDVIELGKVELVASVDAGQQAGSIAFWKRAEE